MLSDSVEEMGVSAMTDAILTDSFDKTGSFS